MNREEFRDALRKGLGRAVQHVRNSSPEVVRDDLTHACTHFLGLNLQEELGSRATWLFSMIEATGEPNFYRKKVIEALEQMPDNPDDTETFNELYSLLTEFAARSDTESLAVMRRRFETANVLYEPHFGFYNLLRIEEIDALIRLLCREWKRIRDDETLGAFGDWEIEYAEKELGKEAVQNALEKESLVNESVRLCLERLRREKTEILARQAEQEKSKKTLPQLSELIDVLNENWPQETDWTDDTFRDAFSQRRNLFWHSGRLYAKPTPEELEFAFQQLLKTIDPGRQLCLLAVFAKETMPRLEPRLLSLLDAPLYLIRLGAEQAFSRMTDPQVRTKGLELVAKASDFNDWYFGIGLLEKNYRPGDELLLQRTLELIPADTDVHNLHAIVMSLLDLIDANAEFSFELILLWAYENTPCPYCRYRCVEQMIQRNITPKNLLEECFDDLYESTRELAKNVKNKITPTVA